MTLTDKAASFARTETEETQAMAVIINGKIFSGNNVSIINGRVTIDGKPQDGTLNGVVEVRITEGDVVNLTTDTEVNCGDVKGNVRAGMGVTCSTVGGDVKAGMNVTCGDVSGSVDAGMGVSMGRRR